MLSRLVKIQLVLFAVITVSALLVTAANYVQVPQQFGVGRLEVKVELAEAGGLYPKANVTYRGTEVGVVNSVEVRSGGGVLAVLSIDDDARIPAASVAQVRSSSVIGEQYVNFVPAPSADVDTVLTDGDTVPAAQTSLPTSTADLLTAVYGLVRSVPLGELRTTVSEIDTAFAGTGPELSQIVDTFGRIENEATQNLPQTVRLISEANGVLKTQQDLDPAIRSYASSLDSLSAQLAQNDGDFRALLSEGSPFFEQVSSTTTALREPLPRLLADTATVSNVASAFTPGLEHVLSLHTALEAQWQAAIPIAYRDDELPHLRLFFKLGMDPPTCQVGYPEAGKFRSPHDTRYKELPMNSFCKAPRDSNLAVRGVRNSPCPNDPHPSNPTMRGTYAADCGLVFPRVPSPTGLRRADRDVFMARNGRSGIALQKMGEPARPDSTWQAWMERLVGS